MKVIFLWITDSESAPANTGNMPLCPLPEEVIPKLKKQQQGCGRTAQLKNINLQQIDWINCCQVLSYIQKQ